MLAIIRWMRSRNRKYFSKNAILSAAETKFIDDI